MIDHDELKVDVFINLKIKTTNVKLIFFLSKKYLKEKCQKNKDMWLLLTEIWKNPYVLLDYILETESITGSVYERSLEVR